LNAQAVANALYGLQGMSSDHAQVLNLVEALADKVRKCDERLSAQEVGNALYGLQGMNSSSNIVKELLEAILGIMPTDLSQFTGQNIGMSLFGLESMDVGEPWRLLLESLIKRLKVVAMSIGGSKSSSKDFISIQTAYQHVSLVLDNDKSALMNGLAELGLAGELHSLQSLLGQKLDDLEEVLNED